MIIASFPAGDLPRGEPRGEALTTTVGGFTPAAAGAITTVGAEQ